MRRTPLRRKPFHADPVPATLAVTIYGRDRGCVAVKLGASPADCRGRLTLDHVKDAPRMGRRAPSDARHLVTVCEWHHLEGWATSHRPELREYLAAVNADWCPHVEPVHGCTGPCNRAVAS